MKKSILNLGKTLNKTEQKTINGGDFFKCTDDEQCRRNGEICCFGICFNQSIAIDDMFC